MEIAHDIKSNFHNLFRPIVRIEKFGMFQMMMAFECDCNHGNLCELRIITYLSCFCLLAVPIGRFPMSSLVFFLLVFILSTSARECNKCTYQHQLFSHLSTNPFRFKSNWYVYQRLGFITYASACIHLLYWKLRVVPVCVRTYLVWICLFSAIVHE